MGSTPEITCSPAEVRFDMVSRRFSGLNPVSFPSLILHE